VVWDTGIGVALRICFDSAPNIIPEDHCPFSFPHHLRTDPLVALVHCAADTIPDKLSGWRIVGVGG
jgi:hypothetical protein